MVLLEPEEQQRWRMRELVVLNTGSLRAQEPVCNGPLRVRHDGGPGNMRGNVRMCGEGKRHTKQKSAYAPGPREHTLLHRPQHPDGHRKGAALRRSVPGAPAGDEAVRRCAGVSQLLPEWFCVRAPPQNIPSSQRLEPVVSIPVGDFEITKVCGSATLRHPESARNGHVGVVVRIRAAVECNIPSPQVQWISAP